MNAVCSAEISSQCLSVCACPARSYKQGNKVSCAGSVAFKCSDVIDAQRSVWPCLLLQSPEWLVALVPNLFEMMAVMRPLLLDIAAAYRTARPYLLCAHLL